MHEFLSRHAGLPGKLLSVFHKQLYSRINRRSSWLRNAFAKDLVRHRQYYSCVRNSLSAITGGRGRWMDTERKKSRKNDGTLVLFFGRLAGINEMSKTVAWAKRNKFSARGNPELSLLCKIANRHREVPPSRVRPCELSQSMKCNLTSLIIHSWRVSCQRVVGSIVS